MPIQAAALGAVTTLALTAGSLLGPVPAAAESTSYVALGDSYSSGTGTRAYLEDGSTCQRSVSAYPALIAAAGRHDLDFRACSGATVADVERAQLDSLSETTGMVTVSVGGNDAGFAAVLSECALPSWLSACQRATDEARTFIKKTLPARLASLYEQVGAAAPAARVVVVGYPKLFNGEDCNAFTWFSGKEMTRLNSTAALLNRKTSAAAVAAGFKFANPVRPFVGHAVCDDVEWLNGLSNPITESFHPNRAGHADGYVPKVSKRLGAAVTVSAPVRAAARRSAGDWAARQRMHARIDASIVPERFVIADLSSPRARAAARAAGVDLSDPLSVAAADRRHHARADVRGR